MSIIDSYDNLSKAIIEPEKFYQKSPIKLDVLIINFSKEVMRSLIENKEIELLDSDTIRSISNDYPVYLFPNTKIGIVKTNVGAVITGGLIEEIGYVFSCKEFVIFGSCGTLDKQITLGKIIIPTEAYRDEGLSYHYEKSSDYIEIKNAKYVANVIRSLNIDYIMGKTWTTDAIYRETQNNFLKRKEEGCISVEMELSACQAICNFRNYQLYAFLYRADNLDSSNWKQELQSKIAKDVRLKYFYIALEIAKSLLIM